ncbi:MAG: type III pantothenate kinase, partial [Spiroplasma sp.]|nr:type III pantothenate kinase [Mycoplasmatales bacterium]
EEIIEILTENFSTTKECDVLISSVVPELTKTVLKFFQKKNQVKLFDYNYFTNFYDLGELNYKTMGTDRVVVNIATLDIYGDNLLIFDLGTAITLDVIKEGKYINGLIFPGLRLLRNSLITGTSQLNTFQFVKLHPKNTCLTTTAQLNDGIILGLLGTINQYIKQNKEHFNKTAKVILTGGDIIYLEENLGKEKLSELIDSNYIIDSDLMYKGLYKILNNWTDRWKQKT